MATTSPHLPHDVESSGDSFEHDHKIEEGPTVDHEGREVHVSGGVEKMQTIAAVGYGSASGKTTLYGIGLCVFLMVRPVPPFVPSTTSRR